MEPRDKHSPGVAPGEESGSGEHEMGEGGAKDYLFATPDHVYYASLQRRAENGAKQSEVEFSLCYFAAAHREKRDRTLLHGHNWLVSLILSPNTDLLNVARCLQIGQAVKRWVDTNLAGYVLVDENDSALIIALEMIGVQFFKINGEPGPQNIADLIWERLVNDPNVKIRVYDIGGNYADSRCQAKECSARS